MRRVLALVGIVTGCVTHHSLTLDFPYPGGAFHDTFVHDPETDRWTIHLDAPRR